MKTIILLLMCAMAIEAETPEDRDAKANLALAQARRERLAQQAQALAVVPRFTKWVDVREESLKTGKPIVVWLGKTEAPGVAEDWLRFHCESMGNRTSGVILFIPEPSHSSLWEMGNWPADPGIAALRLAEAGGVAFLRRKHEGGQ